MALAEVSSKIRLLFLKAAFENNFPIFKNPNIKTRFNCSAIYGTNEI